MSRAGRGSGASNKANSKVVRAKASRARDNLRKIRNSKASAPVVSNRANAPVNAANSRGSKANKVSKDNRVKASRASKAKAASSRRTRSRKMAVNQARPKGRGKDRDKGNVSRRMRM